MTQIVKPFVERVHMIHCWSVFTKHNLQVLYTFWVTVSLASESLFHDGRLALLYLQDAPLDGVCDLPIRVNFGNTACMIHCSL